MTKVNRTYTMETKVVELLEKIKLKKGVSMAGFINIAVKEHARKEYPELSIDYLY